MMMMMMMMTWCSSRLSNGEQCYQLVWKRLTLWSWMKWGRKVWNFQQIDLLIRIQTWEFPANKNSSRFYLVNKIGWNNKTCSVLLYRLETMFQGCSPSNVNAVNVNNTDFMMRPSFQSMHQRSRMACMHHSPRHCHLQKPSEFINMGCKSKSIYIPSQRMLVPPQKILGF
jgi:hypothetical protein